METDEFKKRIEEYLNGIMDDFDEQEIKNVRDIIEETGLVRLSELDNTLMTRIIDDEELVKEIENRTVKEEKGNAFD